MRQLIVKPVIHLYETCRDFAAEIGFDRNDLIVASKSAFSRHLAGLTGQARVMLYSDFGQGEPSDETVENMLAAAGDYKRVFAVGGGSVIDATKLFALKEAVPVADVFEGKIKPVKARELIIVPTTCGTGSEVTGVSVLEIKSKGIKLGFSDDALYADRAVLIPELLDDLPYSVFAASSVDALIHAMESDLSPDATPFTRLFAYKAIEIIIKGYLEISEKGPEAIKALLKDFLIASTYAGISFGNARCAAVHAMSMTLGGVFHVPHGEANYIFLIEVFKTYQARKDDGEMAVLTKTLAELLGCGQDTVFDELDKLLSKIIQRKRLRDYGVTPEHLVEFTENVMTKQGRLMSNNFVPFDAETVLNIYKTLF